MSEIQKQAKAEGQPILDVIGQHERSARSIASNPRVPAEIRARALQEAKALAEMRKEIEKTASAEAIARGRSPRLQDAGPAPEGML